MNETTADICIIGAGSSGIAVAKALHDKGLSFDIFEKGSDIGGMWRYGNDNGLSCAYRSLHIDTSRNNLGYSDFPISADKPDFLSHAQMLEYLEAYADRFGARAHIRFNCEVTALEKDRLGWRVTTNEGTRHYGAVIVANGHLWDPRWPSFPGAFNGTAIHSSQYRTAQPFEDKKVLVVGIGNSAVDIAVDLCKRAGHVALSTRTGAWIMPKYLMGIPVDRWSSFFSRKLKLPTLWARRIMARLIYLGVGDQTRFGMPKPQHPMWREHATLSQELLPYLGHGWLSIRPNITSLDGDAITFADGKSERFDAVVYATGYKSSFPFLAPEIFAVPETGGMVDLYRRITPPNQPGLFFAGLVQPIGPTIPLVEIQARWIAAVLSGKVTLPSNADMAIEVRSFHQEKQRTWRHSARYTLEVDFKDYSGELNGDIANAARGRAAAASSR
ncbi:FAD-dependent oxidoreductase [Tardiphaga sp.]|uniref:flavin-containing monooxygenase n=1 Tax=Tardiphaga sp. TaxID=1926292 RepID=UPI00262E4820|nr:FAD-dependent oxidoreductase [Tardiphaga sp.]MDB5619164.1 monooxygenase [Tardiphaga sp.]